MIQELSAGPIHHVVDLLETIRAAVVRVRNLVARAPLGIEFPEKRSIVLINQQVGNLDSLILNGDNVVIIPIISGG